MQIYYFLCVATHSPFLTKVHEEYTLYSDNIFLLSHKTTKTNVIPSTV